MLSVTQAECHILALHDEYRYAEWPYAECHGAIFMYLEIFGSVS
jgi:hypothetical protein